MYIMHRTESYKPNLLKPVLFEVSLNQYTIIGNPCFQFEIEVWEAFECSELEVPSNWFWKLSIRMDFMWVIRNNLFLLVARMARIHWITNEELIGTNYRFDVFYDFIYQALPNRFIIWGRQNNQSKWSSNGTIYNNSCENQKAN